MRGLHYDIEKGLLLKMDQFHQIQLGSVYRGRTPVPDQEVKKLYNGSLRVPMDLIEPGKGSSPKEVKKHVSFRICIG